MRTRKHPKDQEDWKALWLDAKGVKHRFSIHRTTLRRLVAAGDIRSVSLRDPGSRRGKRLYEVAGIERLLERRGGSQPSAQTMETSSASLIEGVPPETFAERARQLADIAASGDENNAECANADLTREYGPF